jgi:alkyl hydroperoxide reductase subunit AhpC
MKITSTFVVLNTLNHHVKATNNTYQLHAKQKQFRYVLASYPHTFTPVTFIVP